MTATTNQTRSSDPVFVVLQLSGGNDFMNTVIPYGDPFYYDFRKTVDVSEEIVLGIDDNFGFHPALAPFKKIWDSGDMAIIPGIGYPVPDRSHFRSMDIWHTAEPTKIIAEGWLARVVRELDPGKKNVCTGVSFGQGLPRAMYLMGTPAISVSQLEGYGLLTSLSGQRQRKALNAFQRMYVPEEIDEASMVMNHIGQTGIDAMTGADMLAVAPEQYRSTIEYGEDALSLSLKGIAQVHLADLGTRVFYAQLPGFDTHGAQITTQSGLLENLSNSVTDFFDDLKEHGAADNVVMMIFTEFGRRIRDNGNGTDHGSGGGAFLIGERVNGGMYAEYPSLDPSEHLSGDLKFNNDFRMLYSTIVDDWFGIDPAPIVNGTFEKFTGMLQPVGA
ncbi:MAG: DUF1501 domain-containing protein [Dehalococcoidia bacterium]|nr:DUF1501 domain-containing protein [Dehalococcoidia bacterium]